MKLFLQGVYMFGGGASLCAVGTGRLYLCMWASPLCFVCASVFAFVCLSIFSSCSSYHQYTGGLDTLLRPNTKREKLRKLVTQIRVLWAYEEVPVSVWACEATQKTLDATDRKRAWGNLFNNVYFGEFAHVWMWLFFFYSGVCIW